TAIPDGFAMDKTFEFVVPDVAVPRCSIKGSTQRLAVPFDDVVKSKVLELAEGKIDSSKNKRLNS
ncbi:MAG: hypothetical protein RLZZ64_376, partial [Bacteroidota bacterium]